LKKEIDGVVMIGYKHPPLHDAEASMEALIEGRKKVKKEIDTLGCFG